MKLNKKIIFGMVTFLAVFLILFFGNFNSEKIEIKKVSFYNNEKKIVEISAEVADDCKKIARGLMFREKLSEGKGMIFIFSNEDERNFWMKNTLILLDMIFLDADKNIILIVKDAKPCEKDPCQLYKSKGDSKYVIEVQGGFSDRYEINQKTKVKFDF